MNKQEMMAIVHEQLALDYNCEPEDFNKDGIIFTTAQKRNGRREMPFVTPRLEVITMGKSTIVNASNDIMPYIKRKFKGKSNYEIMTSNLVYGVNPYFLPSMSNYQYAQNDNYKFTLIDENIRDLYKYKEFHNALQYDPNSKRPETLAAIANDGNRIVGIACASSDSKTMWQIGVDVLPEYQGNGIAVTLVNMLTKETLSHGIVPYYTTDCTNINSQKVAIKCGYFPAWSHCFRARLPKLYSKL